MASWAIVATVNAPVEQVLAFVAHHLTLNPARIRLYFDDPADLALTAIRSIAGVEAIACDLDHWQGQNGHRPDRHQERQSMNAQACYRSAREDWLLHIDVDEFLLPDRPVAEVLRAVPRRRPILRVAPFEALHDPAMPEDVFTARHFRQALAGPAHAQARTAVFGRYAELLPAGVLSHAIGKCFFRTGIADLRPWLHGARLNGERVPQGPASADLALLHFHAQDPVAWRARLPFRLARGAYVLKPELQAFLAAADGATIDAFYHHVQTATPAALALLRDRDLVIEATLNLRAKIAEMNGDTDGP